MKKILVVTSIIALCLLFFLSYCLFFKNMEGLWKDGQGNYAYFGENSILAFPEDSSRKGLSWSENGDELHLVYLTAPAGVNKEEVFQIIKWERKLLLLKNTQGQETTWTRSEREVGTVKGTLMYRERMALPPMVGMRVQLYNNDALLTLSSMQIKGQVPLPFELCYVKKDDTENLFLRAGLFYENEQLFSTQDPVEVTKDNAQKMSVLLYRGSNDQKVTVSDTELKNTYWRLTTLRGKPVQVFENTREINFVIRQNQAGGSDGCNNFSLPIEVSDHTLKFLPGASTMMMCAEGAEQTNDYMKAMYEADSWSILGTQLELKKGDEVLAIFEAVYF